MRIVHQKMRLSHQINNYYCGPAVVVTVLTAYDIRTTQRKVAQLADTNKTTGTSTKGIVSALGHFGLRVVAMNGRTLTDIRRALARGTRVVVCYTEPYLDSGHYAVVAGFQGGKILLLSPDERGTLPLAMPIKEFQKRWKDDVFTHSKRWAAFVTR